MDGKPHSRVEIVAEHVEFKPQKKADPSGQEQEDAGPAEAAMEDPEEVKEAV